MLLEEMNKQLIIYLLQKILYKQEIIEMKKVRKEIVVFFVLQLQEMVLFPKTRHKALKYSYLHLFWLEFQFSVSGSGFFVLAPEAANFNSLYRASYSLKIRSNGNTWFQRRLLQSGSGIPKC